MNGSGSCLTDGAPAPPVRLRYGEKERPHLTTLAPDHAGTRILDFRCPDYE